MSLRNFRPLSMAYKPLSEKKSQLEKQNLLCKACEDGDFEKVKQSIQSGAKINTKNSAGMYPLHLACKYVDKNRASYDLIEYLIKNKANVNSKSRTLYSTRNYPLMTTTDVKLATMLLNAGANVNQKDSINGPALWHLLNEIRQVDANLTEANKTEYLGFVQLLLQRGASNRRL